MIADKDTGLQKMLKDKGITTVIPVGVASYGAVLYTGSAAALRGFNVIVPADGMTATPPRLSVRRRSDAVTIFERGKRADIANNLLMQSFRGGSKLPLST